MYVHFTPKNARKQTWGNRVIGKPMAIMVILAFMAMLLPSFALEFGI